MVQEEKPFSPMKLHGSPKCCSAPLAGQGCCAALPTSHHCQRRKWVFFPLLATPGEVHYCVLGVLVLEGYCEGCSKQNFEHQDARNGIQGGGTLPRGDVTAAPFRGDGTTVHPSCCSEHIPQAGGQRWQALTSPGRCTKQHQDVQKNFLPIRRGKNGSQPRRVSADFHELWWSPRIAAKELMTTGEFGPGVGVEMLRELQLVSLILPFGRACDVRQAKGFTFREKQIRSTKWWI